MNVSQWTVQRQIKPMGYKNTLFYAALMLTQEQKYSSIQWAKIIIGLGLDLLMKLATSCFPIPLVDDHEIQVLESDE